MQRCGFLEMHLGFLGVQRSSIQHLLTKSYNSKQPVRSSIHIWTGHIFWKLVQELNGPKSFLNLLDMNRVIKCFWVSDFSDMFVQQCSLRCIKLSVQTANLLRRIHNETSPPLGRNTSNRKLRAPPASPVLCGNA